MRLLVVVAALVAAIGVAVLPGRVPVSPAPPPEGAAVPDARAGAERSSGAVRDRREPVAVDAEVPGAARADAAGVADAAAAQRGARPAAGLHLLVLEVGTRRPLPEVSVTAWLAARRTHRQQTIDVAVQPDGRAWLAADALRGFDSVEFHFADPDYRSLPPFRPGRPIDELLAAGETLELLVPRGAWRTFRVVTPEGWPLAGATLEEDRLVPARTGPGGFGRVRLTAPPPRGVSVWAPGFRVEFVFVPPPEEEWEIVLPRANRLEFALEGAVDRRCYHVELDLSAEMQQRTFYQSSYVQTPGKPVDGTRGRWDSPHYRGASHWSLGFGDDGLAVVDHLYDAGTVDAALWRFGERLETRRIELTADGRVVRTEFVVGDEPPELTGLVVDRAGRPVPDVLVRIAPLGGARTVDQGGRDAFPVWAPSTTTDARGVFALPRPAAPTTVLVFSRRGLADRALTIAEVENAGRVVLEPGRTVLVEVRGRDGQVLDGGFSTGDIYLHVRPRVHLGHDVWRDASPRDHPALADVPARGPPWFAFADLPSGVVTFGFTYLPPDELLRHDTRYPTAYYQTDASLSELHIGK